METEQFSLCWNNFQNNLTSGFQDLFKDEDLVDVTLAADGHYIKAHKTVLSVCSPYFKELFRVNPCKHPIVILQDITYSALSALVHFMYRGEVSVSQEEIPTFMKVAELLKVKGLTDNANLTNSSGETPSNGLPKNAHDDYDPYAGMTERQQALMKRNKPIKKIFRPLQHQQQQQLKPLDFALSSSSPPVSSSPPTSKSSSSPPQHYNPPSKQGRYDDSKPIDYSEPLLQPKQEPVEPPDGDEYREPLSLQVHGYDGKTGGGLPSVTAMADEHTNYSVKSASSDASSPGTLQCILGKRGLPRLIVDGYTFFKKSTYKNKCFWYCKTNRTYKCPAVCWTVNGRIVKWPEAHTHAIVPEVIQPGEDTVVPIEMLRQVLIDAAR